MGLLSPLLEIQDIDRDCDRLTIRRRTLSERAVKAKVEQKISAIDAAHEALLARRSELDVSEHEMGDQVAEVAAKAKGIEDTLYGGTVTAAKDLAALQEEIRLVRVRQSELEEQEMALLEEIEGVEGEMSENRSARAVVEGELAEVVSALKSAEGIIDSELAVFGQGKAERVKNLPEKVLNVYERLRTREKLNGVAAAPFTPKGCGGCNMQLPSLESRLMREQPEDAVLNCENCGRLLVR